jgi:peroxiredoxin
MSRSAARFGFSAAGMAWLPARHDHPGRTGAAIRPARRAWLLTLALACLAATGLQAGEFNEVLSIGDPAPAWTNLPGVDGRAHSLADLRDKQVVVVVFTCNSCDVATAYEDRLIALANQYAGSGAKVAFVAINVNTIAEDRLDQMKVRAKQKGYPFAYLFDETQQIAKDYGATFTPEFFVLNGQRRVVYMGGMDNHSEPAYVTERYLAPAIEAALVGQPPPKAETVAIGCRIRYQRARR